MCCAQPSLTQAHPAREVGVLKRHGMDEGESELRADLSSLDVPSRGGLPRDIFSLA